MQLSKLLSGVKLVNAGKIHDIEITGLEVDSRKVTPGCLFVCIRGMTQDGHEYIGQALSSGAAAVLCEYIPENAPDAAVYALCEDMPAALGTVCASMYGNPLEKLDLVGVTGTKGKTSTTYYISAIMNSTGAKTGLIGTNGAFIGNKPIDIPYQTSSTPDILELYRILAEISDNGAKHAVMEATSHGLVQRRMEGITFKLGVFTNITRDHLDYHKTFENYIRAKALLFRQCELGLINRDAKYVGELLETVTIPVKYFGIGKGDGYFADDVELLPDGVRFKVYIKGRKQSFSLGVPGKFTVYNALAAIAAASELGVPADAIAEGLNAIKGVPGRFESIPNNRGISVIVDYAHTPDSLENIITAVREFTTGKVITLFGCGGDRDRGKRPQMGKIVGELSDFCVVTSDNPRNEKPQDIIYDILPGIKETNAAFTVEPDRKRAIETAINTAKPGDTVILAGKGHEPYMEFENRRREPFDDKVEARKVLDGGVADAPNA
ncbi:MAG: UDP-N-acetylmuramoyl-L-alanyl-D-glutamate--2,6-diaminopimelate ligase [Defluviitaleaceae bacterium]|nr:UDP-N-acetylmuramoyl-L-alanyl-D-glutamate--2,6-diaminopimelate ligase [Defluviitaleaceae bacterium]MCL2835649.1 UDP-N-acetylmuramoyl-L-alanyl-D-glutamate--2,6-diaminopimelate ligase [Defluviitaleaceae bacterium]